MSHKSSTRRAFLTNTAKVAAAAGVTPYVWTSDAARAESANDRLGVGAIGVGGRGSGIGHEAARQGNMIACADVDRTHAESFASRYAGKCQVYGDYRKLLERKDIEVVTIGTPDHWHAKIAIDAMLAGKDVYCEKPLTLTIDEGKQIGKVVKQTGRVFQVGTQQRSTRQFLVAVALARSGRLGKTLTATCSIGEGPNRGPFEASQPPKELDWDAWLGQAPKVPYVQERCHRTFRYWLEYSGGTLTDWGAHHVDIAHWGIGCELTGPIEIAGQGQFPNLPGDFDPVDYFAGKATLPNVYNTVTEFQIDLRFANGSTIRVQNGTDNGVWFEGEDGRVFVNRGKLTGKPIEELTTADKEWLEAEILKLYKGRKLTGHMQNFFDCVKDRGEPVSDVFSHHRELSSCHLCNIAMLLKRKLRWDPEREDFVGDQQASALVARPQREPFAIRV